MTAISQKVPMKYSRTRGLGDTYEFLKNQCPVEAEGTPVAPKPLYSQIDFLMLVCMESCRTFDTPIVSVFQVEDEQNCVTQKIAISSLEQR